MKITSQNLVAGNSPTRFWSESDQNGVFQNSVQKIYKIMNNKKRMLFGKIYLLTILFFITLSPIYSQTAIANHGQLKVTGTKIVDKNNNPVVLRGMSLFWSQWIGKYYSYNTIKWLRDDWCINVIRASMAVDNGGYATNAAEKNKVIAVVDAAIELGIYVIIDFHVHNAPNYLTQSKTFFTEMSLKYKDHPNVLYEIWNEPLNHNWSTEIKPYSETIINTIRQNDPDNIIICGTRTWSQRVDEAANDPINKPNIAYTLHYYASSHKQSLRNYAVQAINKGIALFVTEYGICAADGNGAIDENESKIWWKFLEDNHIGYCNWSVADKNETSAILKPGASVNGNWSTEQLSPAGILVRNQLRSKCNLTYPNGIVTSNEKVINIGAGQVYPNPTTDEAYLVVESVSATEGTVAVTDMLSRERINQKYSFINGSNLVNLDTRGFEAGIYIVTVELGRTRMVSKIQITK